MKILTIIAVTLVSTASISDAYAKGCIKGAIVGGIAGHLAGHGVLGAAGGCAVGHHLANRQKPTYSNQNGQNYNQQNYNQNYQNR